MSDPSTTQDPYDDGTVPADADLQEQNPELPDYAQPQKGSEAARKN
jgi:hypothetical protein